jgi:hypothetical protein
LGPSHRSRQRAGAQQLRADLLQQIGQWQPERPADAGQDLRGGLLAAALDFGQVRQRDAGGVGHILQGAALLMA